MNSSQCRNRSSEMSDPALVRWQYLVTTGTVLTQQF